MRRSKRSALAKRRRAARARPAKPPARPGRAVGAAELEEWSRYVDGIGFGDPTAPVVTVVIRDAEEEEDALLAHLLTRATLRGRRARVETDDAWLWFELYGPDGWVMVGRKVPMPIDAEAEDVSGPTERA